MHTTHSDPSPLRRILIAAAVCLPLAIAGCASPAPTVPHTSDTSNDEAGAGDGGDGQAQQDEADDANSGGREPGGAGVATLAVGDQSFTFDLNFCALSEDDVLMNGLGADDGTGEPAYLDVDVTTLDGELYGEVRVDLGVDTQFSSSDDILVFMTERGEYVIDNAWMTSRFSVTGLFSAGGPDGQSGTFEADCS